jgi:superfamily II DNA helicase RecQ
VYVTPEKLGNEFFMSGLVDLEQTGKLALVAIDEAHCVSEWGHDFRPAYMQLHRVRENLHRTPIMTLTATAVPLVQDDIVRQVRLNSDHLKSVSSFDRENLQVRITAIIVCASLSSIGFVFSSSCFALLVCFPVLACFLFVSMISLSSSSVLIISQISVIRKMGNVADHFSSLVKHLSKHPESTIVYVPTVRECETVYEYLRAKLAEVHVTVGMYHGSVGFNDRKSCHLDFLYGKCKVVVATVAFGMGIDKADVRNVYNYGPPKTMEEYYQQIGRAGRDGLQSKCVMLYSDNDFNKFYGTTM